MTGDFYRRINLDCFFASIFIHLIHNTCFNKHKIIKPKAVAHVSYINPVPWPDYTVAILANTILVSTLML